MTRFIKITVKFLLLTFLSSMAVSAKPIGVIKAVSGKVFVFSSGNILEGSVGMTINDYSSVTTEVGGQLTIADYHDRLIHLSGSSNITFMKNLIELKSGYLWVQGKGSTNDTVLKTSNAQVVFNQVEGIISYDPGAQKTQVLTITGHFDLSNIERSFFSERVQAGTFSFVEKNYENGNPRKSTPIGKKSYLKVVSLFSGIEPLEKNVIVGGRVSSYKPIVKESPGGRFLASNNISDLDDQKITGSKLMEKELGKLKKIKKKPTLPTHPVKINIFWPEKKLVKNISLTNQVRSPASVSPKLNLEVNDDFQADLVEEYKNQQKHKIELHQLINELDSYKDDFNTNY